MVSMWLWTRESPLMCLQNTYTVHQCSQTLRGVARGGGHGWMSPRHGLKKIFSPWITDRWLLCNWCHTSPDVAKTKRKCAISTFIFRKFSGGIAPRLPYWGRATAPLPDPISLGAPALRASAPRSRSLHRRVPPCKNPGYAPVWKDVIYARRQLRSYQLQVQVQVLQSLSSRWQLTLLLGGSRKSSSSEFQNPDHLIPNVEGSTAECMSSSAAVKLYPKSITSICCGFDVRQIRNKSTNGPSRFWRHKLIAS